MTELRQRMLDAMVQRGFAPSTQAIYVGAIRRMAKHYRRDPATYTQQEVQAYLLHMVKDEKLSYSSMNQAACAVQFLFQNVLGHTREHFHVPFAKVPAKQPELLAREEISRVLVACWRPERRMLLQTVYATGLRVSEACALRVGDIDSAPERMCIRVSCGKGGKGRYSILSPTLLDLLRAHVRNTRTKGWLFTNASGNAPMGVCMAQRAYYGACRRGPDHQDRWYSHAAPLFCDASAGGRRGPVHDSEVAGPRPHQHDRTLPAPDQCAVPAPQGDRPVRSAGRAAPVLTPWPFALTGHGRHGG